MLLIGLSGGIGAGKSLACAAFAQAGALVIDSDLIAREVVAIGTPGLAEIQLRFGHEILNPDGSLNRASLADIVFNDEGARADLERITHPRIVRIFQERVKSAPAGKVVVHDVPLLVETGAQDRYQLVVMIEASLETRLERLEGRGLSTQLALTRMKNQGSDQERRSVADIVLNNDGPSENIQAAVNEMMEHRLLPFAANIAAERVAVSGHACPNLLSAEEALARILERINVIVPASKVSETLIQIERADDALYKLGFVPVVGGYASCDPGRAVQLRIDS
ncbi:unannotated protein [freshwater metagenome]|uniref:Unannotated protein n=1 Tax=freshwater metagenome TaxID=449393 RepID=A0A6J6LRK4_9ZZZZ|nr:dephospho-CoA kinase [Actinomycetota bacterium]MSY51403.1 dephospho-CoA kinase [Actinomycetota bacterium]MSY86794.1 dephospho-CoA kinase [Actinomycetota bacterium]